MCLRVLIKKPVEQLESVFFWTHTGGVNLTDILHKYNRDIQRKTTNEGKP